MKRLLTGLTILAALLAIPLSHSLWGKAHVPLGKVQVCHKGETITVSENALPAHQRHGDCQLPACDFANIFQTGQTCNSNNPGGQCAGLNPRVSAEGVTDACPVGTF